MARREDESWHTAVWALKKLADLANIGIVLHIVILLLSCLFPPVKGIWIFIQFSNLADIITAISDPLIYLCKGSNRTVRLVGRKRYQVEFVEEQYGRHENQNTADIISTLLFGLAITAFILSHFFFPPLASIAWIAGLAGTGINVYFDEIVSARKAKEKYYEEGNSDKNKIEEYYKEHYYESIFYTLILVSLFICLPCKSLAQSHFLPVAEKALTIIAAIGGTLVAALNIIRGIDGSPCFSIYQKLPGLEETATINNSPSSLNSTTKMIPALGRRNISKPSSHTQASPLSQKTFFFPSRQVEIKSYPPPTFSTEATPIPPGKAGQSHLKFYSGAAT